jgi:hypothetical protein
MLERLAANLRGREGGLGTGIEGVGAVGENTTIVIDDNCTVCLILGFPAEYSADSLIGDVMDEQLEV